MAFIPFDHVRQYCLRIYIVFPLDVKISSGGPPMSDQATTGEFCNIIKSPFVSLRVRVQIASKKVRGIIFLLLKNQNRKRVENAYPYEPISTRKAKCPR